ASRCRRGSHGCDRGTHAPLRPARAAPATTARSPTIDASLLGFLRLVAIAPFPLEPELAPQQCAGIVRHRLQHRTLLRIELAVLFRRGFPECEGVGVSLFSGTRRFARLLHLTLERLLRLLGLLLLLGGFSGRCVLILLRRPGVALLLRALPAGGVVRAGCRRVLRRGRRGTLPCTGFPGILSGVLAGRTTAR